MRPSRFQFPLPTPAGARCLVVVLRVIIDVLNKTLVQQLEASTAFCPVTCNAILSCLQLWISCLSVRCSLPRYVRVVLFRGHSLSNWIVQLDDEVSLEALSFCVCVGTSCFPQSQCLVCDEWKRNTVVVSETSRCVVTFTRLCPEWISRRLSSQFTNNVLCGRFF